MKMSFICLLVLSCKVLIMNIRLTTSLVENANIAILTCKEGFNVLPIKFTAPRSILLGIILFTLRQTCGV